MDRYSGTSSLTKTSRRLILRPPCIGLLRSKSDVPEKCGTLFYPFSQPDPLAPLSRQSNSMSPTSLDTQRDRAFDRI
jgi:hypothetical protein